ncbi:SET domain-containing protein [Pseudochryseolinea flava]|uniref:SET domain-containing protein n=1 Tax=Pseudochryseolinea flava TaxID=2059302 RepID=A0A364XUG7_9BACT|nr:SET domain-containing protein-lysine N-methyltransferase [Pseudochryseolinea flava]RAV97772.1 SET domain-containing protein [Pseudochryseolinea flava]
MALLEKYLFVKKSTIPNSGKGLFTKKAIAKGTRIVEYKGKKSAWKDVADEDGKNGYIFYVNRNHVINALPTKNALARYANDARGLVKIKGINNNCDYVTDGLIPYIESKKDIPAGAEIFVDYGKDYWKVIRENIKLWKQEAKDAEKEAKKKKATKSTSKKSKNGHKNGKSLNGKSVAGRKAKTKRAKA